MKYKFPQFPAAFFIVVFCISTLAAQTKNSPYRDGEILIYEGKLSKIILRGVDVVDLSFTVASDPISRNYTVNMEALSKGSLTKLLGFKFYQKITSTVDNESFSVLRTIKRDEQGDRIRNSISDFNYEAKTVTYIENDPNNTARPPYRIASTITDATYDLVSSIYALRHLPLAVGKSFSLNVSDSGLLYRVPVRVTAREIQNTIFGKVICYRVEPDVFGDGKMIEQKGSMKIWITDDPRRVPVRSQINTSIGRIEIKLLNYDTKKTASNGN